MNVRPSHTLLSPDNRLFSMARSGKRLPHGLLATLVLGAVIAGGSILVFLVALVFFSALMLRGGEGTGWVPSEGGWVWLLAPNALMIALLALWVRFYEGRPFASAGFGGWKGWPRYFTGFGLGLVMVSAVVGLMAAAGVVRVEIDGPMPHGFMALGSILLLLLCFVVQGGAEEIVCRGWYMPVVGARHGPLAGLVLSTLVFAAGHVPTDVMSGLNVTLYGLFLALLCLREGGIWSACGWHSAWNWFLSNGFGLTVTRHEVLGGSIVDLETAGPVLLTGGNYGPEKSLMATLVVGAGIAFLALGRGGSRQASGDRSAPSASLRSAPSTSAPSPTDSAPP